MSGPARRRCPICESSQNRLLFTQEFSSVTGSLLTGYDVVICTRCGVGFADGIPEQATFDAYYREMSKYENQHRGGEESDCDRQRFEDIADLLSRYIPEQDTRVLDIGCATGGLLACLKERGFTNLCGLDPSPACAETAKDLHGLRVLTSTASELAQTDERYDFVILVGVLEHMRDVAESVAQVRKILSSGGMIYVEVPDATGFADWPDAPFQQFSTEHINYFSRASVANLMCASGFTEIFAGRDARDQSRGTVMPVVTAVYRKEEGLPFQLVRDERTESGLMRYIERSREVAYGIQRMISDIADSRVPIVVWGVGTHTLRLMETSRLSEARITAFVDSNPKYQGKDLHGVPIVAPEGLKERGEPVLISSRVFQNEIEAQIRQGLGCSNELILLYPF